MQKKMEESGSLFEQGRRGIVKEDGGEERRRLFSSSHPLSYRLSSD